MPRRTAWVDDTTDISLASGSTSIQNPMAEYTEDKKGLTVTRIICTIMGRAGVETQAAIGFQRLAVGIGIAGFDAIEQGAASLPDPNQESQFPPTGWLYRGIKILSAGVDAAASSWVNWDLDLRAQRKLLYGDIFLRLDNANVQGTSFTCRLHVLTRVLVRLP